MSTVISRVLVDSVVGEATGLVDMTVLLDIGWAERRAVVA